MTMRRALTLASAITMTLTASMTPATSAQERQASAGGIQAQFAITLPDGWSVYDQNEAISGKPSAVGMVIFSAQPVTKAGSTTADPDLLAKVATGEMPSFFVDRQPGDKGAECTKLSRGVIYDLGTKINQDPSIRTAGRALFGGGLAPKHTDIELGGCKGVRFLLEANKNDAARHRVVDVRAVSDGKVIYLFSVRNPGVHYKANLDAFEKALATVRFVTTK